MVNGFLIAAAAVIQAAADPTDRSGTGAHPGDDLLIVLALIQQNRGFKALCHILQFLDGAKILQKRTAVLRRVHGCKGPEQNVQRFGFVWLHILPPAAECR